MLYMLVVLKVLKEDKSRNVSDEQFENIQSIFVTFEVSNPERLRDSSDVQPENM